MKDSKKSINGILGKLPYGIFCGSCAMFVFFATAGLIVSYLVFSGIASQTSDRVAFLEYGWQTVLFAFDIIFAIIMAVTFVLFILKKRKVIFAEKSCMGEENESV